MSVIKAEQLTKVYRQGDSSVYAVNNANVTIDEADFAVITGKSGSGKSTFLNMCAGMLNPTSGKVIFDGKTVSEMSYDELAVYHREKIGMIFQTFELIPIMTVRENIMLTSVFSKRVPDKHCFNEIVETLGISDRLEHFPDELSGGQAQRVAIARALMNRPKIIFADEPTGNLDPKTANEIITLLLDINRTGVACLLVTHDMSLSQRIIEEADHPVSYHFDNGIIRKE